MAKSTGRDDRGRVKFRVIEFDLEGGDDTLQDAIRGLTAAITERGRSAGPQRLISGNSKAAPAAEPDSEPELPLEPEEGEQGEPNTRPRAPRGSGKPRATARPKVIEIDLTSGDEPLKSFLESLNPENDSRRYLAIAYWFKNQRQIESIGMNHMYTAYRSMGWNLPDDPLMPFRNMKNKGWFANGTARGEYTLNHIGEGKIAGEKKKK